jgi:hypothetical protein
VEPEQAQDGPLDGHGRVPPDEVEHLHRDAIGERAAPRHLRLIENQIGDDPAVGEPHVRLIGSARVHRKEMRLPF